jgi:hypothetical protein
MDESMDESNVACVAWLGVADLGRAGDVVTLLRFGIRTSW